jgi:Tol biopolymer transport system component
MRRLLPGVALGFVLVLLVVACGGGSSSAGPPDLVFVSSQDGDYALFGMTADGQDQHRLTKEHGDTSKLTVPYFQWQPAFSPDGGRIAFSSNRTGPLRIYVMNADGTDTRPLTAGPEDQHPTWSPDGKRIAFVRGAKEQLTVMNADGRGAHRITHDVAPEEDPAWSPDGRWIAFSRKSREDVKEIWLARPDGSQLHQLTKIEVESTSPSWAPGSDRIVFVSNLERPNLRLFVIRVDGKRLHGLATAVGGDDIDPAWAPEGKTIAFSRDGAIVTVTVTGGAENTLTNGEDNDSSPTWNPRPETEK